MTPICWVLAAEVAADEDEVHRPGCVVGIWDPMCQRLVVGRELLRQSLTGVGKELNDFKVLPSRNVFRFGEIGCNEFPGRR